VQVDVDGAWFRCVMSEHDESLSNLSFNFILRRYSKALKSASADVRLTLKREVLVNEGLGGATAKGARVRDNFDASLYNPQAQALWR
jgi:hypothetical protein